MSAPVTTRPAIVADSRRILDLVNQLALEGVMLPRSPASVIENIRDFTIAEKDGEFAGCGALAIVWTDLAEVRSLAVHPKFQRLGVGRALVDALSAEARHLGLPRLFCFTYEPEFFGRLGFEEVAHEDMPHKVFNDCVHCPKFHACDEIAMEIVLDPDANPKGPSMRPRQRSLPLPTHTGVDGRPRRKA